MIRLAYDRKRRGRAGLSLIEVAVSLMILSVMAGGLALVGRTGMSAVGQATVQLDTHQRARRALDRVVEELQRAGASQIAPTPGAAGVSTFTYRIAASVAGGAITWSSLRQVLLELDPAELDDGDDDDGDGQIDERQLVLVRDVGLATENRAVICTGISELFPGETFNGADDNGNGMNDEAGFVVQSNGALMELRLALQRRGARGETADAAYETSVLVRN